MGRETARSSPPYLCRAPHGKCDRAIGGAVRKEQSIGLACRRPHSAGAPGWKTGGEVAGILFIRDSPGESPLAHRAQSETGRIAIGGQVAGAVVPSASLTLKVRRESGRVMVEASGSMPSTATTGSSFLLQPLADWKVKPAWEQKVKTGDKTGTCKATWLLSPNRALLHPGIDVQVLWVFPAPSWHVELYARCRSEGRVLVGGALSAATGGTTQSVAARSAPPT